MSTTPATTVRSDPADIAVAFSQVLRGLGLRVPASSTHTYADALGAVGLEARDGVYWAGRATLVRRPEDIEPYDRAFAVFFEGRSGGADQVEPDPIHLTIAVDTDEDADDSDDDDSSSRGERRRDDRAALLRRRGPAAQGLRRLRRRRTGPGPDTDVGPASGRFAARLAAARSRRRRATRHPDIRQTVRASLRAGGEPARRQYRAPSTRLRRLVLVLDVSGSMEPYARALLRFVHAAVAGRQKVEAFALGTRLTRVTRELTSRDPDVALQAAGTRVSDWSGGTRLGAGLRTFNDEWGVRGLARNSIVVIMSDGWDRGDPDLLAEQMQRLQRVTHRLIWVNPLKVTPGYAPLARGMAAALPYVDRFVEGHSLDALDQLARVIAEP